MFTIDFILILLLFVFILINMTSQLVFRVGDYVEVDGENRIGRRNSEGGKAYIADVSPTISVRYVISGLLSPSVVKERIQ